MQDWGISKLCYEVDTEPYAMVRDGELKRRAEEAGVEVMASVSHTLYVSAAGIIIFYKL